LARSSIRSPNAQPLRDRSLAVHLFEPRWRSLLIEKLDGGDDCVLAAMASSLKAPDELDRVIAIASFLQPKLRSIQRLHPANRSFPSHCLIAHLLISLRSTHRRPNAGTKKQLIANLEKHRPDLTNRQMAKIVNIPRRSLDQIRKQMRKHGKLFHVSAPAHSRGKLGDKLPISGGERFLGRRAKHEYCGLDRWARA
jgi:hypothetical protein